jgi:integrase
LRVIWQALGATQFGDIVRLLLLSAQRREEVGGLRWPEIDFDRGVISLPPERTKNTRPHEIPMSTSVRAILAARPRTDRPFVFGRSEGSFSAWATSKQLLDQRLGGSVAHWTLHDLRRSAATGMADIGVQPHIIEAVLNHVSGHKGGVAGIYNRSSYTKEKAEALTRWDEHVRSITGGV